MCPWQTNTSRVSQSSTKTLFLLDVTLGIESVHFNVSWKVNVRARSELSHFARSACLMWSSVKWSAPRHASFPQQGQSWHFLSLVRAHVSSSRSAPCPASQRRTHRGKKHNFLKWWDRNNFARTNKHTCHPRATFPWPCRHVLLLSRPVCSKQNCCHLCRLSSCFPLCFIVSFLSLFPCSPPPRLHRGCCLRFQSQSAAGGQSDVPLKPEEFTIGESTGEKFIVFPSVQSTPSACHINPLLFLSVCLPPSPSRCKYPADFPLKHMLQLWVGCHLSL